MKTLHHRSESDRRQHQASWEIFERPVGCRLELPKNLEQKSSRKKTAGLLVFFLALALVGTFAYANSAHAQAYSHFDPALSSQLPSGTSVEEAISEAVDLAYEDLYDELYEEQMLTTSCSVQLAKTGVGSQCSCTATGRGATCVWNQNNGGQTSTAVCTDGMTTTTCAYAPNGTTCGCQTR